jgi:hypothetical protein
MRLDDRRVNLEDVTVRRSTGSNSQRGHGSSFCKSSGVTVNGGSPRLAAEGRNVNLASSVEVAADRLAVSRRLGLSESRGR